MPTTDTNKVLELFGCSTRKEHEWAKIVGGQHCPYANMKCYKVRKSAPDISIGTCSLRYGRKKVKDIVICPNRLLQRRQVFMDCTHLLTQHYPGNELHVIPEVSIPGGSVDYFLVSVKKGKVKDFVAIEFQTLDTTGTVWFERLHLLHDLGVISAGELAEAIKEAEAEATGKKKKTFGMNWKMTAETILMQIHHKVDTIEHVNKRLVLAIQDHLLEYLRGEFNFAHIEGVRTGDTAHIHSYKLEEGEQEFRIELDARVSTDAAGAAECLNIQAETKVELETIIAELEKKISARTILTVDAPMPHIEEMPTE
ncbi:MAG: hypothetical protein KY475_10275 [Planctomycetes bacterium]|nr:hypothetical protein [Planctomycetota bacterium]